MSAGPELRPHHDWQKIVLFVLTLVGAVYAAATQFMSLGRKEATLDKVDKIDTAQGQQKDEITRLNYRVEAVNGAVGVVGKDVTDMKADLKDLNTQLRQLNLTGRHR